MAQNEPTWSLGKSKVFTSSGATVGDGDDKWSLGKSVLFHEFVAAAVGGYALKKNNAGTGILVHLKKNEVGSGVDPVIKYNEAGIGVAVNTSGS